MIVSDSSSCEVLIKNAYSENGLRIIIKDDVSLNLEYSGNGETQCSPIFYIHKEDMEFLPFLEFFVNCNRITKTNIILDDRDCDLSESTILQYTKDGDKLKLFFRGKSGKPLNVAKRAESTYYNELFPHFKKLASNLLKIKKSSCKIEERVL